MKIKKSEVGIAVHGSLPNPNEVRPPAPENKRRKISRSKRLNKDAAAADMESVLKEEEDEKNDNDSDEMAEIERKIMALQKIVPGGESLDNLDNLFEETADYILDLQNQVKAMRLLANLFQLLDNQNTKLGG